MKAWFPHDKSALLDDKVQALVTECGIQGYGLYWAIVERLYTLSDHKLTRKDIPYLCRLASVDEDTFLKVLGVASSVGLLARRNGSSWTSKRVLDELTRSQQKKMGGNPEATIRQPRGEGEATPRQPLGNMEATVRQKITPCAERNNSGTNKEENAKLQNPPYRISYPPTRDKGQETKDITSLRSVCPEPSGTASGPHPESAPIAEIPTNRYGSTGEVFLVSPELAESLREAYPAVDVEAELRRVRSWSMANAANRKTLGGMPRFLNGWMAKQQDRTPSRQKQGGETAIPPSAAHPELADRSADAGRLNLFGGGAR